MHRKSYWKSIALMFIISAVSLFSLIAMCFVNVSGVISGIAIFLLVIVLFASSLVAAGGLVCLWRDGRIELGVHDPIGASLNRLSSASPLSKVGLRSLLGKAPRPGDIVEVKSFDEIQATLDTDSSLNGLPFMQEMRAYCGLSFRVHRRVDKINDMRHKTGLRRMKSVVTLTEIRCGGEHHGGCQAGCQILWKDSWLRRTSKSISERQKTSQDDNIIHSETDDEPGSYVCQMTRLWEASRPMTRFDIMQDLRPLLLGNVKLGTYMLVILTRLFNIFQGYRRGAGFPNMPNRLTKTPSDPLPQLSLTEGQNVMVKNRKKISQTLNNNRTKGLWFDRDMVRFCGHTSVVQKRVDRIIHEATGKMVKMKTPSWILHDVTATGEFLRLCPQHEYIFWREAWLLEQPINQDATTH